MVMTLRNPFPIEICLSLRDEDYNRLVNRRHSLLRCGNAKTRQGNAKSKFRFACTVYVEAKCRACSRAEKMPYAIFFIAFQRRRHWKGADPGRDGHLRVRPNG